MNKRIVPVAVTGAKTRKLGNKLKNKTIGNNNAMITRELHNESQLSSDEQKSMERATADMFPPMKEKKTVQIASCCEIKLELTKKRNLDP